jgi:UDP-N-acetylmuramate--alanine ligase
MKHIHMIGIGGTGLSAIARVLLQMGYTVSGSDQTASPLFNSLKVEGVNVYLGHAAENIQGADIIIRSSAVQDDNVEVQAARAAGIPVLKRADFLGQLMEGHLGIAIAGTHGKTTTTAMIVWMLTALGQQPSFIVGSVMKNLNTNAQAGKGVAFVIEADEYDHMFLGLNPRMEVVTNIEYDHPDCFPTPQEYRQAFVDFANRLSADGTLLACADDPGSASLLDEVKTKHNIFGLDYSLSTGSDYQAQDINPNACGGFDAETYFRESDGSRTHLGSLSLQVPGIHNLRNALAAVASAHLLGLPTQDAARALDEFTGTLRRFDIRGTTNGITVIDDYAHHPTEIRTTLEAARARYPGQRIWAVWQPHTFSRTQALLADFTAAFSQADRVIITEIYAARGHEKSFTAAKIAESMPQAGVIFIPQLPAVAEYLVQQLQPGDILLVLSAGDADQVSSRVLAELGARKETV